MVSDQPEHILCAHKRYQHLATLATKPQFSAELTRKFVGVNTLGGKANPNITENKDTLYLNND